MEHLWCYHFCLLGALPGQADVPSHLLGLGPHSHCQAAAYTVSPCGFGMTPEPPARLPSKPPPGAGDHEGRVPAQSPLVPALPLCSTGSWGTQAARWRPARGWHPARGWWAWLCGREADSVVPPPGPALPELHKASCHVSAGTGRRGQEHPCLTPGKMSFPHCCDTSAQAYPSGGQSLKCVSWGRSLLEAPVGSPRLPIPASAGAASLARAPPPSSWPAGGRSFYVAISGSVAAFAVPCLHTLWSPEPPMAQGNLLLPRSADEQPH